MSGTLQIVAWGSNEAQAYWHRPRCPSKALGRTGTRRAWKRDNPPGIWMLCTSYDPAGNVRDQFWTR